MSTPLGALESASIPLYHVCNDSTEAARAAALVLVDTKVSGSICELMLPSRAVIFPPIMNQLSQKLCQLLSLRVFIWTNCVQTWY